jgi:hypothetical protein
VKTKWLAVAMLLVFLIMIRETKIATPFVFAHTQSRNHTVQQKKRPVGMPYRRHFPIKRSPKTDFDYESSNLLTNVLYHRLSRAYNSMSPNGANGANVRWESNQSERWYIEAQRYGEGLVIGGLIKNDAKAIEVGFKMFDWGFARQSADGSFKGTGDPFHSTSFFVQAVARTLLVIQQSPQSSKYAKQVARYKPLLHRAARWMISADVWNKGTKNNQPYTHRRYLVAAALGLTSKLTGDRELLNYARMSIKDGLALQRPDGVNPEKGGYDSSYQMVGVVYAQRWLTYFPNDPLAPKVVAMINQALTWEQTKILPTGEIANWGNTRTWGQESGRAGKIKKVDYNMALRGFAYWAAVTKNPKWALIAHQIAQFYYHLP